MSRTINNLVDSGLVIREMHAEDRRYVVIRLTEDGRKAFEDIETSMKQYYENIFLSIPAEKRGQVIESLELVVRAAKENKCCPV
jgi:DNA-binding MarR family transcriptional regulator